MRRLHLAPACTHLTALPLRMFARHVREALVRFAREGWQAQEQLSFWKSPLGPMCVR